MAPAGLQTLKTHGILSLNCKQQSLPKAIFCFKSSAFMLQSVLVSGAKKTAPGPEMMPNVSPGQAFTVKNRQKNHASKTNTNTIPNRTKCCWVINSLFNDFNTIFLSMAGRLNILQQYAGVCIG
jgi:hypothetical protein